MSKFRWSVLPILVVLVAGLLSGQTSQAPQTSTQNQGAMAHHPESPEQHLQMLSDKLNLTDDQKAKIKPILENQSEQMKAVHNDASLSQEQKREKKKAIHESCRDQINAVLTPEQQVKFKQLREEHMEKHQD
jgi:protein CpxP